MKTVRINFPLRPLRQLSRGENVGRLDLEVRIHRIVLLRVRFFQRLEVDSSAERVRLAGNEDHTWGEGRGGGGKKLGCQEFREEERADVIGGDLLLEAVFSEFEGATAARCVVNENLGAEKSLNALKC